MHSKCDLCTVDYSLSKVLYSSLPFEYVNLTLNLNVFLTLEYDIDLTGRLFLEFEFYLFTDIYGIWAWTILTTSMDQWTSQWSNGGRSISGRTQTQINIIYMVYVNMKFAYSIGLFTTWYRSRDFSKSNVSYKPNKCQKCKIIRFWFVFTSRLLCWIQYIFLWK